jgi:2-keto-4-pentenoate hydratase
MMLFADDARIAAGLAAQRTVLDAALAGGSQLLGWKVGFGAPAALTAMTLSAPLTGFLLAENQRPSGATCSIGTWTKPAAEPEIAVRLGRDIEPGGTRDEARAAIDALAPAIELADVTFPPTDVAEVLAGNIYQRHVVLGAFDIARAHANLDGVVGHVRLDGQDTAATTDLEANTGRIVDIVRHVADVLPLIGQRLRAGQIIIAGSIVPPIFLTREHRDLRFALDTVGEVVVAFA